MIIDLDGFRIDGKYYVREMGVASLTRNVYETYSFHIRKNWKRIAQADKKHIWFCTQNVHGLRLYPEKGEWAHSHDSLKDIVRMCYEENKTREKFIVAFKGGHVEQDLLNEMGIPHKNLEDYGCPRIDELPPAEINDCGYHFIRKPFIHCPKQETWVFAKWFKENILKE